MDENRVEAGSFSRRTMTRTENDRDRFLSMLQRSHLLSKGRDLHYTCVSYRILSNNVIVSSSFFEYNAPFYSRRTEMHR